MGLEIVIGRAPTILGWAYALLGPVVDMTMIDIDIMFELNVIVKYVVTGMHV